MTAFTRLARAAAVMTLLAPHLLVAQFGSLATPDDGSVLYFSTPMKLKGTDQADYGKIFRWDAANGSRVLVEQRDPGSSDGCTTANFYQLSRVQVSADGQVIAWTASRPKDGGKFCPPAEADEGVVRLPDRELHFTGRVAISRNGHYAITTTEAARTGQYHFVTDLRSGTTAVVSGDFSGSQQRITNTGATVATQTDAVTLSEPSGLVRVFPVNVPSYGEVRDVAVTPSGRIIVYQIPLGPASAGRLAAIDTVTGRQVDLALGFGPTVAGFSSDETVVFYVDRTNCSSPPYYCDQLFAISPAGGSERMATSLPFGGFPLTFSGDGRAAYSTTQAGELIRLDTSSGMVTELASATPQISKVYRWGFGMSLQPVPTAKVGWAMDFSGTGLDALSAVDFCGQRIPYAHKGLSSGFWVPWDAKPGPCRIAAISDSPFESSVLVAVESYDPQFEFSGVYHQAFRGFITAADPAVSGEVLATYVGGLAPVDAEGHVSPGFGCTLNSDPAAVEYLAPAPKFLGYYQINIRLPSIRVTGQSKLQCGWEGQQGSATIWTKP